MLPAAGQISGIRSAKVGAITGTTLATSTVNGYFGGSSLRNTGVTTNYLLETPVTDFAFGTGNFTIEFWYYTAAQSTIQSLIGFRPQSTNGAYISMLTNYSAANRQITFYTNNAIRIQSATNSIVNNTWMAIALVRNSGVTTMYINGTASGSTYTDTTNYAASRCVIGSDDYSAGTIPLNGYIDELRISRVARYTSNYTPATEPFIDDASTVLLLHFDQANGSKNIVDDNS